MNAIIKRVIVGGSLAVAALGATPVFAAGTASGTAITNTVTVDFQVGGVAQTQLSANNVITVDRKVNLTVVEANTATFGVTPGQSNAYTTFTVTNTSNATIDIGLTAAQLAGGTAAHGGTDVFNLTGMSMFVDTNANGIYDAGTDTAITYIDELAADQAKTIFIVGTVPLSATNGQVAGVTLTGQAQASGTVGTQGANLTATAGANTAGVDTVLADAVGLTGDIAADGKHSDDDDYTVSAPLLSVYKQSRVIEDPVNTIASGNAANAKMIPGATVEYCLVVVNAAGGATASTVNLNDTLPAQTAIDGTFTPLVGGTYTGTAPSGTCNADGTATPGAYSAGVISGSLGSLTTGQTRTIVFRVKIL
ncbi:MAG: hypothetical protein RIS52_71 [Pseudomonadota bacterium]|jgi:hypothetical protein